MVSPLVSGKQGVDLKHLKCVLSSLFVGHASSPVIDKEADTNEDQPACTGREMDQK